MLYLAISTFLIFTFIAYKKPLYALIGLCALLPSYLLRFELFGLPSTILEVIIWGIFFGWLAKQLSLRVLYSGRGNPVLLLQSRLSQIKFPLALFFLASIVAVIISPEFISALGLWRAYFLEALLVFLLFLATIKDKEDFSKIIFGLSISALYISIFAIGQKFFGLPIPVPWQAELRATSIFPYPNAVGLYLGPLIFLFLYKLISNSQFTISNFISLNKKSSVSIYWLTVIGLSLISIFFAHSDGAIFALLASGIVFIFLNLLLNKKYKSGIVILLLLLIAGGILFGTLSPVQDKILLKDWSGFVRLTMWGETLNMLKNNWFLGTGLNGFSFAILPYHESREWMEVFLYPHNIILNFWTELGLIGLATFLWLIAKFGKMCYKILLSERKSKTYIITAICAMLVILIHGLVDVPYFKNDLAILFWIIYAIPIVDAKWKSGSSG